MTALLTGARLAHEVELDAGRESAQLLAAAQELRDGLPALFAVVAREVVHVHADEAVRELGVEATAEPQRVLHRLGTIREPGLDRLLQDLGPEVAPCDVDPKRERQTCLQEPPLAEVDDLLQALGGIGELALVDQ